MSVGLGRRNSFSSNEAQIAKPPLRPKDPGVGRFAAEPLIPAHSPPGLGAGIYGCMELGVPTIALCKTVLHEQELRRVLRERLAGDIPISGSTLSIAAYAARWQGLANDGKPAKRAKKTVSSDSSEQRTPAKSTPAKSNLPEPEPQTGAKPEKEKKKQEKGGEKKVKEKKAKHKKDKKTKE